uniref:AlNc14C534G12078 protein n=1 Tax=Albugo laibachii Nc14 TaxID=890382 RepID=F0X0Z0_9STRA|nr:AlNc14C534G12078 [Albugo laibachii Nc14]|eukprot:CCA27436.1 AlNc14C534G12078 [Albugo laibachii Nc14]
MAGSSCSIQLMHRQVSSARYLLRKHVGGLSLSMRSKYQGEAAIERCAFCLAKVEITIRNGILGELICRQDSRACGYCWIDLAQKVS